MRQNQPPLPGEVPGPAPYHDTGAMGADQHHHHDDASDEHVHTHGTVSYDEPQSRYRWQIHHPFEDVHHRAAIEVAPWSGLAPTLAIHHSI